MGFDQPADGRIGIRGTRREVQFNNRLDMRKKQRMSHLEPKTVNRFQHDSTVPYGATENPPVLILPISLLDGQTKGNVATLPRPPK